MVKRCRDFGRDLARAPVEVFPTAHFMMGGVVIDTACRTALEGLFAAGEDTGGVHGANRLGGNGVAESTVFGGIAGDRMAEFVEQRPWPRLSAARLIVLSALERRESRGAHFRRDFPDASPDAPVSVRVRRQHGTPAVWSEPVRLTRARPPAALRPAAVDVGD
jgi:aspartate oxidase